MLSLKKVNLQMKCEGMKCERAIRNITELEKQASCRWCCCCCSQTKSSLTIYFVPHQPPPTDEETEKAREIPNPRFSDPSFLPSYVCMQTQKRANHCLQGTSTQRVAASKQRKMRLADEIAQYRRTYLQMRDLPISKVNCTTNDHFFM